jgi:hypothetical protein
VSKKAGQRGSVPVRNLKSASSASYKKAVTGADRIDLAATRSYLESFLATSLAIAPPGTSQDVLKGFELALEEGVW